MKKNNKIEGVIYPIPKEIMDRSIKEKKNIFVKNTVHDVIPLSLREGSKILFYVGVPHKKILAEAFIEKILILDYVELKNKYKDKLMQTKEELKGYCGLQFIKGKAKKVVFLLKGVELLKKEIDPLRSITMTGKYFTPNELKNMKHSK